MASIIPKLRIIWYNSGVRILIAGSSGGIGSAVAQAARTAGYDVIDWNRADFESGAELPDGPYDAFVFATGMCCVKPVTQLSDEDFLGAVRVNCLLFVRLVREIVKRGLNSADGMKVVAVSSVSANEGWPGGVAYCASKGALSAACRALDTELSRRGVSVRAIEPRYVKTRMFDGCAGRMGVPASEARDPRELADEILKGLTR